MTMTNHFTRPTFTARTIARVLGQKLDRRLSYKEADEFEELDGEVNVTDRVHVQVGADYLVVFAYQDRMTFRSWPARPNIPYAFNDLLEALRDFPDPIP
jgi:hypothetical protein